MVCVLLVGLASSIRTSKDVAVDVSYQIPATWHSGNDARQRTIDFIFDWIRVHVRTATDLGTRHV